MRFTNGIIIIGVGLSLAGLIERVIDRPVIVVTPQPVRNDIASLKITDYPELVEIQKITSTLDELTYLANSAKWVPKFGHPKRKTNKLRCKYNAKLKRRK